MGDDLLAYLYDNPGGSSGEGYDAIDSRIVWSIIEEDLSKLLEDVRMLMEELDSSGKSN